MQSNLRRGLIPVLALVAISTASAAAPFSPKDAGSFKPLFNGKDFTGWVLPPDKDIFTVEDGVIIGRTKEG